MSCGLFKLLCEINIEVEAVQAFTIHSSKMKGSKYQIISVESTRSFTEAQIHYGRDSAKVKWNCSIMQPSTVQVTVSISDSH